MRLSQANHLKQNDSKKDFSVFVRMIPSASTKEDLMQIFGSVGEVKSVNLKRNTRKNNRNTAVVKTDSESTYNLLLKGGPYFIGERELKVDPHLTKSELKRKKNEQGDQTPLHQAQNPILAPRQQGESGLYYERLNHQNRPSSSHPSNFSHQRLQRGFEDYRTSGQWSRRPWQIADELSLGSSLEKVEGLRTRSGYEDYPYSMPATAPQTYLSLGKQHRKHQNHSFLGRNRYQGDEEGFRFGQLPEEDILYHGDLATLESGYQTNQIRFEASHTKNRETGERGILAQPGQHQRIQRPPTLKSYKNGVVDSNMGRSYNRSPEEYRYLSEAPSELQIEKPRPLNTAQNSGFRKSTIQSRHGVFTLEDQPNKASRINNSWSSSSGLKVKSPSFHPFESGFREGPYYTSEGIFANSKNLFNKKNKPPANTRSLKSGGRSSDGNPSTCEEAFQSFLQALPNQEEISLLRQLNNKTELLANHSGAPVAPLKPLDPYKGHQNLNFSEDGLIINNNNYYASEQQNATRGSQAQQRDAYSGHQASNHPPERSNNNSNTNYGESNLNQQTQPDYPQNNQLTNRLELVDVPGYRQEREGTVLPYSRAFDQSNQHRSTFQRGGQEESEEQGSSGAREQANFVLDTHRAQASGQQRRLFEPSESESKPRESLNSLLLARIRRNHFAKQNIRFNLIEG